MSSPSLLAPLFRALAVSRAPACACRRAVAAAPSPARPFSTTRARTEQASWDSLVDDAAVFKTADASPDPSTSSRASRRPSRQSPSPARKPRSPGARNSPQGRAQRQRQPHAPPLPPMHPLPTLQDLDPFHLQQLRLSLSNSLRRLPSDEELEDGIKPWLKREYKALEQQENERAQAAKLRAEKREQLDLAWEWQRQAEESAGMRRTTQQRAEDAKVFARLEERRRAKEQARLEQEAKQWEAALGVTPKTREGRDQRREGDRARLEQSAERDKNVGIARELPHEQGKPAPEWLKHRQTLQKQFPTGWAPPKRISREAMDLIRSLHGSDPERYSTPVLSARFKISPEAVRRVLRSKFEHTVEEKARREAQRKEDRIRQIKEGASAGELQWEGNLAAQKREQDELRRKAEAR